MAGNSKLEKLWGYTEGMLQLLQQELPCNAVAAECLSIPLQLLQLAVATAVLCWDLHSSSEKSGFGFKQAYVYDDYMTIPAVQLPDEVKWYDPLQNR